MPPATRKSHSKVVTPPPEPSPDPYNPDSPTYTPGDYNEPERPTTPPLPPPEEPPKQTNYPNENYQPYPHQGYYRDTSYGGEHSHGGYGAPASNPSSYPNHYGIRPHHPYDQQQHHQQQRRQRNRNNRSRGPSTTALVQVLLHIPEIVWRENGYNAPTRL